MVSARRLQVALVMLFAVGHTAAGAPADWTVHREPFDPDVVARYKQVLARDPYDPSALAHLEHLYRVYRTLGQLDAELQDLAGAAPRIVRARMARDRDDLEEARRLFAAALEVEPGDARAWLALGAIDRQRGQSSLAQRDYEAAVALAPPPALREPALHALVDIAREAGDAAAVTAGYDQLVALQPRNGRLWLERGDAELGAGDPGHAAESFAKAEQLLAADPERKLDATVRRGDALAGAHDDRAATEAYWRALREAPAGRAREVIGRIVDASRRLDALHELIPQLEAVWSAKARTAWQWSALGDIAAEVGDRDGAIAALGRAVHAAPAETETARRLMTLLDEAGRSGEALAVHTAALRAAPGDLALALALCDRMWLADPDGAVGVLRRSEARFARDPGRLGDIAAAYTAHLRFDLAERLRERIVRSDPANPDQWLALARAYLDAGDTAGAIAVWRRIAKPSAEALTRLGDLLREQDAFRDAAAIYAEAIVLDPRHQPAWRGRISALDSAGSLVEAIACAERALAVAPGDEVSRHRARHDLIELLRRERAVAEGWWSEHVVRWTTAVEQPVPDPVAGALIVDAAQACIVTGWLPETGCDAELFVEALSALTRVWPGDPIVAKAKRDAIAHVADPDDVRVAVAVPAALGPPPDPPAVDASAGPVGDGADQQLRLGAQLGAGTSLRAGTPAALAIGARGVFRITDVVDLATRLEWTQRDAPGRASDAIGTSIGAWARVATTPSLVVSLGANAHAELHLGDGFAAAGELETDLTFRHAPVAIGARVEQALLGGALDTRLMFEMTLELR